MSKKKWYSDMVSQKPTKVNGQLNTRSQFYRRELYKIIKSCFDIKVPETWDIDYVLNQLIIVGYIFVVRSNKVGVIALKGSLTGINYLELPTKGVFAAPMLGNWTSVIGKDCELIYLERNRAKSYYNFQSLVQITAQKLASCDCGIDMNVMNSRLAYAFEAESKAQGDTIKAMYDEITEGNPLVVYRKDALTQGQKGLQVFFNNIKQNYIADVIQDTKRSIMNEFLTSLGINNANTDKRERLNSDEVNSNNIELMANVDIWKLNLKRQLDKVRSLFPDLDFDIKLRYDIEKMQEMSERIAGGNANDTQKSDRNVGNNARR